MTEENYNYRTSPLFLRNQSDGKGNFKIPIVPKFIAQSDNFNDLRLIGFNKTKADDTKHLDRMIHFFLYDYKFERVWKNPDTDLEKLRRYRAVLTPDFSMYIEMAPALQLYNTFRNRWCGAYYASKGIRVIPTVSWGEENTFEFCFDGIEKGGTVAVSTYMVSEHGNRKDQKEFFLKGYNELLRRVEPEKIICYNEPFPEKQGDIVFVDYDLSSWQYMDEDYVLSKYAKYICGLELSPENSGIIIKRNGYVLADKGMGSAEGGDWQPSPNKPQDERYLGEPGEINETDMPNGDKYETKIGDNGKAEREQHYTYHNRPDKHSNPHDHDIDWFDGFPNPGPPINYPGGASGFKSVKEVRQYMGKKIIVGKDVDLSFDSISDFKWCIKHGDEVNFSYNEKDYGVFPKLKRTPDSLIQILISQTDVEDPEKNEQWYDTADEALEYIIDGVRLRDIITEVEVTDRTV